MQTKKPVYKIVISHYQNGVSCGIEDMYDYEPIKESPERIMEKIPFTEPNTAEAQLAQLGYTSDDGLVWKKQNHAQKDWDVMVAMIVICDMIDALYMTSQEAAAALGISKSRVCKLLADGDLLGKKFGVTWMAERGSVEERKANPSKPGRRW